MKNMFRWIGAALAAVFGTDRTPPPPAVLASQPRHREKFKSAPRGVLTRWFGKKQPSLREQILAANSVGEIRALLTQLAGWNTRSRTVRRCRKAAKLRATQVPDRMDAAILCAGPVDPEIVYAQFSSQIEVNGDHLPDNIQWAPPGTHTINGSQDGKPVTKTVVVNAKGAAAVKAFFDEALALAKRGEGDEPWFDYDHDGNAASAHPTEIYWGGDDLKTGGIRAKVEWTAGGSAAVIGKDYTRFSPAMKLADNGEIVGSDINMGGLVNRAAFQKIQPVRAKGSADPDTPHQDQSMKTLLTILAKAGLISSADLDEASAVSQFQTNHAALLAKQTAAESERDTLKAKNGELTTQLTTAKTENETLAKAQATSVVEAAILAKKIAPGNETLKAKLIADHMRDPEGTKLLIDSMTENPAFQTVVRAKGAEGAARSGAGGEHEFLVKAKALATERKIREDEAVVILAKQQSALYDSYRESLVVYAK